MAMGIKRGWRDLDGRGLGSSDHQKLINLYPYALAGWNWGVQVYTTWTTGGYFYPVEHASISSSYPSDEQKFIGPEQALVYFWRAVELFLEEDKLPRILVPSEAPILEGTITPDIVTRAEIKDGVNRNPEALRDVASLKKGPWPYGEIVAYLRGNEPPRKPDTSYEYGRLQEWERKYKSFQPESYYLHRPILDQYDGDGVPPLEVSIRFHSSDDWDNPDRYTSASVRFYSKDGNWHYDGDPYIKEPIDRYIPFDMIKESSRLGKQIALIWRKKLGEYTCYPVLFSNDKEYLETYNRLYAYDLDEIERSQIIQSRLVAMHSFPEKFEIIQRIAEDLGYSIRYSNSPFGMPYDGLPYRTLGETCVSIVVISEKRRVHGTMELDPAVPLDYDQIRDALDNARRENGCVYSNKTV